MVGQFFKIFGVSVNLFVETCRIQVSAFTMHIIPRCSGLDILVLLTMFLSIYAWRSPLNPIRKLVWMISIIPIAILTNIVRIFLLTLAGANGLQSIIREPLHTVFSILILLPIIVILILEEKIFLTTQKNIRPSSKFDSLLLFSKGID